MAPTSVLVKRASAALIVNKRTTVVCRVRARMAVRALVLAMVHTSVPVHRAQQV
jgi:hypothetical protein